MLSRLYRFFTSARSAWAQLPGLWFVVFDREGDNLFGRLLAQVKIGVLADTHIPDLVPHLPPQIEDVFRGLDIILHAGDICRLDTLHELEDNFTITIAVAGESDSSETKRYLENKRVVRFANRSIGMIHGHREERSHRWLGALRKRLLRGSSFDRLYRYVLGQFEGVDCIVFGHSHHPYVKVRNGVLLFNPGAAARVPGSRPSVGILDVSEKTITGRIIYLQ